MLEDIGNWLYMREIVWWEYYLKNSRTWFLQCYLGLVLYTETLVICMVIMLTYICLLYYIFWCLYADFCFLQFMNISRSKFMRSRISSWLPEGRMHDLLRSRGAKMLSSSKFVVPSISTHSVSLTLRRLTNWSNLFLQVGENL